MRPRDPRRLLMRRTRALARVKVVADPESSAEPDGATSSRQSAIITLPRAELERVWRAENLERIARTYWSYLTRISLGILKVIYSEDAREVVVRRRPFVLLGFRAPEYETAPDGGSVTWRIDRGLLVAPPGRGRGYLRISVRRLSGDDPGEGRDDDGGGEIELEVASEVSNFYPALRGWGALGRIGALFYRATQLRIHVLVTHGFLRSLARLELEPSVVGALAAAAGRERREA